ncbi:MAG: cupin domain-containing protein [Firmicutes bacterium]|nr:cupin domain-containing protein [Bacillota bacterium]
MLRLAKDMTHDVAEGRRGGKGPVEMTVILRADEMKGPVRLFNRVTLLPGSSIGYHQHEAEEEIYYILRGQGMVNDNGIERAVQAGDALLTGDGAGHAIENTGSEPLEMVAIIIRYC